ncbi:MAG TPA: UMP kinase [Candidatus Saccharimonadales bacterium]
MKPIYHRILIKLSGEQLVGEQQFGIDAKLIQWIANEVKATTELGVQVVIMVGGGNFVRGAEIAGGGITRINADYMGMLGTMMNGLAMTDIFNEAGVPTRLLTSVRADQVADPFTQRRAFSHLNKGRVVVLAGGIGLPYVTTDTAAMGLALQLECDVVCKLTKVDGVYDRDPVKFSDAKKLTTISFQQAVEDPNIKVMDKAAMGFALEHNKPIAVFALHQAGNLKRFATGEPIGTLIKD